jgi:hypothetical protein
MFFFGRLLETTGPLGFSPLIGSGRHAAMSLRSLHGGLAATPGLMTGDDSITRNPTPTPADAMALLELSVWRRLGGAALVEVVVRAARAVNTCMM